MPLEPGKSQAVISRNISELTHHGSRPRTHAQIVAIALSNADRHPHRATGGIGAENDNGFARGGFHLATTSTDKVKLPTDPGATKSPMSPHQGMPWFTHHDANIMERPVKGFADGGGGMTGIGETPLGERDVARQIFDLPHSGGLIGGTGFGRTDRLPLSVPAESHVIPADVVSGLGQGTTAAGGATLAQAIKTGPWGLKPLPSHQGHGPPSFRSSSMTSHTAAEGGAPRSASILAASGEFVVIPEEVEDIGKRGIEQRLTPKGMNDPMKAGHWLLDEMIHKVRAHVIKWTKRAPPPKKSIGGAVGAFGMAA